MIERNGISPATRLEEIQSTPRELSADRRDRELSRIHERRSIAVVAPQETLIIYGGFNSDPVIFYRGQAIETDKRPIAAVAASLTPRPDAIIMTERTWQ